MGRWVYMGSELTSSLPHRLITAVILIHKLPFNSLLPHTDSRTMTSIFGKQLLLSLVTVALLCEVVGAVGRRRYNFSFSTSMSSSGSDSDSDSSSSSSSSAEDSRPHHHRRRVSSKRPSPHHPHPSHPTPHNSMRWHGIPHGQVPHPHTGPIDPLFGGPMEHPGHPHHYGHPITQPSAYGYHTTQHHQQPYQYQQQYDFYNWQALPTHMPQHHQFNHHTTHHLHQAQPMPSRHHFNKGGHPTWPPNRMH